MVGKITDTIKCNVVVSVSVPAHLSSTHQHHWLAITGKRGQHLAVEVGTLRKNKYDMNLQELVNIILGDPETLNIEYSIFIYKDPGIYSKLHA